MVHLLQCRQSLHRKGRIRSLESAEQSLQVDVLDVQGRRREKKKEKKLEKKGAATPSVSLRVLARVGKPDSERHLYTKFGRTSGNSRKSRE